MREIFAAFEAQGAPGATTTSRYLLKLGGNATGVFLLEVTPSGVHWKNKGVLKPPGTIVFEFLPPIPPGLKRAEFMRELEERLESASNRLIAESH